MNDIDMRTFARSLGTTTTFPEGSLLFQQGQQGDCAYVVQSGTIELLVGDQVVDECKENDLLGYMSLIDGSVRSSSAKAISEVTASIIDERRFRYMVDEIPNFATYVMKAMAQRIRGLAGSV